MKSVNAGHAVVWVLVALIITGIGFFAWWKRGTNVVTLQNASGVVLPLMLKADDPSLLTAEQKDEIADFRERILKRVRSNTPLTAEEKATIKLSIATTKKGTPPGTVLVDQNLYQFTDDELRTLFEALDR